MSTFDLVILFSLIAMGALWYLTLWAWRVDSVSNAKQVKTLNKTLEGLQELLLYQERETKHWQSVSEAVVRTYPIKERDHGGELNSLLNADDLKRLVHLCHPDKHGGSSTSCAMTVKLNSIRAKLQ